MLDLNPDSRLDRFLSSGYLPRELPPTFVSTDFGKFSKAVGAKWKKDGRQSPKTWPEIFSAPRHGRTSRRKLAIVNPISHYYLSREISSEWDSIKRHLSTSKISKFKPSFSAKPNVTFEPIDFEAMDEHKNLILSRYNRALVSDISRFYPTLYTHVIAWAMHGKDWCKQHQREKIFESSLGNRLDVLVRKGQDNQSVGVPIGPETSRVIAEIVGVGIDKLVAPILGIDSDGAYRYVDDLCVGINEGETADSVTARLASALSAFELEINVDKTREIDVRADNEPEWAIELRHFDLPSSVSSQRRALEYFFKKAFRLSASHPGQNVLNYAVKRSSSFPVAEENWSSFEAYILRCMRANATTIEPGCRILIDAFRRKRKIGTNWVGKLIGDIIKERAPLGHHAEVSWALFLAREMEIKISKDVVDLFPSLESGVCGMLSLDLQQRKLLDGKLNEKPWSVFLSGDGLKSHMWLLAYEAATKGWLKGGTDFIKKDEYFSVLMDLKISFYDTLKTVPAPVMRKKRVGAATWPPLDFFEYF